MLTNGQTGKINMQVSTELNDDSGLILAAEDYSEESFLNYHYFSGHDNLTTLKLMANDPILLQGERGSGKSALLIRAEYKCRNTSSILGFYLNLKNLHWFRSKPAKYKQCLCEMISQTVKHKFPDFPISVFTEELQETLVTLARRENRRLVLLFDDAVHIGREANSKEFFELFKTFSNNYISCKATIYPGVTEFGKGFDINNDADVLNINRDEHSPDFDSFFNKFIENRYPNLATVTLPNFPRFLGLAVLGNVRAFIKICHLLSLQEDVANLSLRNLDNLFKEFATDYYHSRLAEMAPKLGKYEPLVEVCRELVGNVLFAEANNQILGFVKVHREVVRHYLKLFELLEYVGFIARRNNSAMKFGGRGTKFALNLPVLLERLPNQGLTEEIYQEWSSLEKTYQAQELYSGDSKLASVNLPALPKKDRELSIWSKPISFLEKSKIYPYGLTKNQITILEQAGFETISQLAEATAVELQGIEDIGEKWAKRIKNVVLQAIWI